MSDLEITKRLDDLERRATDAEKQRDEYHRLYLEMMERCRKLELGILGSKSEHLPPNDGQLALGVLGMVLGDRERAAAEEALNNEEITVPEHTRNKPTGRKPLPENLWRVDIELVPIDVQQAGLDAYERIGEEVTETLERRPGCFVVVRSIRPKFVLKDRKRNGPTTVLIAETSELPIPKGIAGPGLLADTIVRRWQDHLPLNRLEGIYAREGVELARSTMCGWHFELAELVKPLIAAMHQDALRQPYVCIDATGVLVQQSEKCRTGHFWVLVAPQRHVLFSDPKRAQTALDLIGMLFRIERTLAGSPRKKKEAIRKKRSKPIVDSFLSWCDAEAPYVLDDTPISAGIRYARNQRVGLSRFVEDGRLPIHNNLSELNLRREAVGRKNWLFVGNDEGGEVNAAFTSLLASCALCRIEPWTYLRDLLCLLPQWPEHRVLELSPIEWHKTRERVDVIDLLDKNPFRRATTVELG